MCRVGGAGSIAEISREKVGWGEAGKQCGPNSLGLQEELRKAFGEGLQKAVSCPQSFPNPSGSHSSSARCAFYQVDERAGTAVLPRAPAQVPGSQS